MRERDSHHRDRDRSMRDERVRDRNNDFDRRRARDNDRLFTHICVDDCC